MEPVMTERDKILKSIYNAVDEVNEQLPEGQSLEKSPSTVLLGESGKLESIDLVNILVATEENIEEAEDVEVEDDENVDVDVEKDVNVDVEDEVDIDDESVESDIEVKTEVPGEDADTAAVLGLLTKAQDEAVGIGDEVLMDQIGNTITYFTRKHVVKASA